MTARAFSPQHEPVADLAARTVGREAALAVLRGKLDAAATSSARPHVLIVGRPGSGKTHLLEVALADLPPALLPVRIPESAIGVTRYEDLPAAVLRTLQPGVPLPADREARIAALLEGRTVLLVVERLDRLFADLGLAGQRALRAWVETSGSIMLAGTADRVFPAVLQRQQPWFGGLAVLMLPELTAEQGRDLMLRFAGPKLARYLGSAAGLARAAALADLTGGSPRVWTLAAQTATVARFDALLPVVADLLEALVAYHDQVLSALSPNERRLVAAIADSPGAATVSMLAGAADIEQRTAAGALGRLAEAGRVTGVKPTRGDRRTTYYRLSDPLLRLHLLYRAADPRLAQTVALVRTLHEGAGLPADAPDPMLAAAAGQESAMLSLTPDLQRFAGSGLGGAHDQATALLRDAGPDRGVQRRT